MITISRSLLKRLRIVCARGLGLTPRSKQPPVEFRATGDGLSIRVRNDEAAVTCHLADVATAGTFAVTFEWLKQLEGTKNEPLTLRHENDEVIAEWSDAGIPQVSRTPVETAVERPELPTTMQANPPDLMPALRDAVETADREATRYALNCLRLRGGHDGQIAATDGQQLLIQQGFVFPWDEDVLIPASRLFACADVQTGEPCEIGKTDEWVTLISGPWTIQLRIETESRFPSVDDHILPPGSASSTLHITDQDAEFFTKSVKGLPANGEFSAPVTVDLNGEVAIRAKREEQPAPTELVLNNSRRDGEAIRFNTNRNFLKRALQLGFRSIEFSAPEAPTCCRDQSRTYVWALLSKEGALQSDPNAVRIESPAGPPASPPKPTESRRSSKPMPKHHQTNGHTPQHSAGGEETNGATSLIEQAETLKSSLQESLSQTRELITALKRQKKQSKLMKTTLASLRQLQNVDV